jgi:ZIP family zinc transporter
METVRPDRDASLRADWRIHARNHPYTALGLRDLSARIETTALGLAAGAMIFVVSHEVISETHRNGHQTPATLGLMAGFAIMILLDTTLG